MKWKEFRFLAACLLQTALGTAIAQTNLSITDVPTTGSPKYRAAVDAYLAGKEPKIVGGKLAADGEFPWQVSLGVSWIGDPYNAHFCGGSIIADRWILTAAHCLVELTPKNLIVTAGTNKLGVNGSRHTVKRLIVKKDYNAKNNDNDIALIELFRPLVLGEKIATVSLLKSEQEADELREGAMAKTLGWGATTEGGGTVRDLRFVDVPIVSNTDCNRPLGYDGAITANMICAGERPGGKDSCQGDSGGPLVVRAGSQPLLAGVVSWGEGCARPNLVGVYARVANYHSWISSCMAAPETCQ